MLKMRPSVFLCLLLLPTYSLVAQPTRDLTVEEMETEPRVALIIGNSKYSNAPLKNPVNDASDMAEVMKNAGFYTILALDSDAKNMTDVIREFGRRIQRGGVGLFYYAGHAVQVNGENYLIPVNSDITSEDEVPFEAVNASRVLAKMETAGNRVNILILDACRNNPFPGSSRSASRGLAKMDAARGTFVAYATSPGRVASDGDGRNGLYTQMLLKHINLPGKKLEEVFKAVRTDVLTASQEQVPWDSSSLTGEFYFQIPDSHERVSVKPIQTISRSNDAKGSKPWLWILLGGAAAAGAGATLLGGGGEDRGDEGTTPPTGMIEINIEAP